MTEYKETRNFYREMPNSKFGLQRVAIRSPQQPPKDVGIRLYSSQYKQAWELQIRGFYQKQNYEQGNKWYFANAHLDAEDLRALRDACNDALRDVTPPDCIREFDECLERLNKLMEGE